MTGPLDDLAGITPGLRRAAADVWTALARPGGWWDGADRIAIAAATRTAAPQPPGSRAGPLHGADRRALATAMAARAAVGAGSLTRAEVAAVVARLGDAAYAELCSVVSQVVAIDQFRLALGVAAPPLPPARPGAPSRSRPQGAVDIGAHIAVLPGVAGHNIARSLTLAGADHDRWLLLVHHLYAGDGFETMIWEDTALSRPQVELLAARTSALNECFY